LDYLVDVSSLLNNANETQKAELINGLNSEESLMKDYGFSTLSLINKEKSQKYGFKATKYFDRNDVFRGLLSYDLKRLGMDANIDVKGDLMFSSFELKGSFRSPKSMTFTITLPVKPEEHNSVIVSNNGKTLEWNVRGSETTDGIYVKVEILNIYALVPYIVVLLVIFPLLVLIINRRLATCYKF